MWTLALCNQKGGVGKTVTALNLAAALAESGRQVLLVDLDPQGHLTDYLRLPTADGPVSLAGALTGAWDGSAADLVVEVSTPGTGSLAAIGSGMGMFLVARELDRLRAREHRLAKVLSTLDPEVFDVVVLDCPPSLDVLTDNALTAADALLVPVQAEDSSLRALRLLLAQVAAVDADLRSEPLELLGCVVNLLRRPATSLARSVLTQLEQLADLPLLATVPLGVVVVEAWRAGQAVMEYAPDSEHAAIYRDLAALVDKQVN